MPPKPIQPPLAAKMLKLQRKTAKLTQTRVAEYMGFDLQHLRKIESGSRPLTKTTWLAYRMALQDLKGLT